MAEVEYTEQQLADAIERVMEDGLNVGADDLPPVVVMMIDAIGMLVKMSAIRGGDLEMASPGHIADVKFGMAIGWKIREHLAEVDELKRMSTIRTEDDDS